MPPVRSSRNRKPPPDGFDDIEDTLLEFGNKMKDAENASHEGKKRHEVLWPIFQISHQRSRYVYDLYYEKEAISKALYDYLIKNSYADANLIAKWKKQGYEKLCCLRCIQTKETNFNATCICRVPKAQLKEDQTIECAIHFAVIGVPRGVWKGGFLVSKCGVATYPALMGYPFERPVPKSSDTHWNPDIKCLKENTKVLSDVRELRVTLHVGWKLQSE
ncbi:MAG: hypothetical protein M1812_002215 [Candelaria pacifica]|nr:MAG: hypothetical protein M1812_002215 [Candelaria pacifica]